MPRIRPEINEAVGQDSFLDVVTNIVGILIILVMVVGIRAKQLPASSVTEATPVVAPTQDQAKSQTLQAELSTLTKQLAEQQAAVEKAQENWQAANQLHAAQTQNAAELEQQTELVSQEIQRQRVLQGNLTKLMALSKLHLDELQKKFSGSDQHTLALQQQLITSQQELKQLSDLELALQSRKPTTVEVPAQGTPLSKVVDGAEAHFQLRGERIAYVPLEELVEMARRDMKPEIDSLKTLSDLQASTEREFKTGVRRGFEMRYALMVRTDSTGNRVSVGMSRFEIFPTQSILGETVQAALVPGSQFLGDLKEFSPRSTTITLWVYADSFGLYRTVQEELRKQGYTVAGRLMPLELPIGGSPNGKRSLAQ